MGNLPECRLELGMVFRNTGVELTFLVRCWLRTDVAKSKCTVACLSV